jgi:hypothetical protein
MALHRKCCCTLQDDEPRLVRAGWYHFLLLTTRGYVKVFIGQPTQQVDGANCEYSTVPAETTNLHPLHPPATLKKVIDIESGAYHCIVRQSDHTIACWGLNAMGQCDVPTSSSKGNLTDPANANLKKIVGLHAGYSTTAVTFSDGSVVCWGDPEVADVVNHANWQKVLMSPPPPSVDPHTAQQPDLTAIANIIDGEFYKGQLTGAYNTDASAVTYNLNIDRLREWHGGQHPALPMFSLGVETDPHQPLEFDPIGAYGYGTPLPSIHAVGSTPVTPAPDSENTVHHMEATNYEPFDPESLDCPCEDPDNLGNPPTADAIEKCWRDYMFALPHFGEGNEKSCCDLEIKKDFAVALLRNGQIVTSRNTNADASCPANRWCRDCSLDEYQVQINAGPYQDFLETQCNCPGDYRFIYERNGSVLDDCQSGGFGFGNIGFPLEGIGCVAARPGSDAMGYDPNWAKAANGMGGRWTSAEQVRPGNPAWNGTITYGWANSAQQLSDQILGPDDIRSDCVVWHPQSGNCNTICSSNSGYNAAMDLNDFGVETKYEYPIQFWTQQIQAGTNTTFWCQQPPAFGPSSDAFFGSCDGQLAQNQICENCGDANRNCGRLQQYQVPNGGLFSYGCIYSWGLDKHGYPNSWRSQANPYTRAYGLGLCDAGPNPAAVHYAREGSRPWGPWQIAVRNGIGDAWNRKGSACHWCYCPGQAGQIVPSANQPIIITPGTNDGWENPVASAYGQLDVVLGTLNGFPFEGNLQPFMNENVFGVGGGGPYADFPGRMDCWNRFKNVCICNGAGAYTGNPADKEVCDAYPGPWQINGAWWAGGSYWGTTFGMYHSPKAVASSRMAFAMVRAEHRVLDPATGEREEKANATVDFPGPVVAGWNDPTQYETCNVSQAPCAPAGTPTPCTPLVNCPEVCDPTDNSMEQRCVQRRSDMILLIWGSLWDPCPPWPRQCAPVCYELGAADPPAGQQPCCNPEQTNPEASDFCCDEEPCDCDPTYCCDPATSAACECNPSLHGPCVPPYPCWTRVPAQVQIGSAGALQTNTVRTSAKNGTWVKVSGQNVRRFTNFSTPSYPPMPMLTTEQCIDCEGCSRATTFDASEVSGSVPYTTKASTFPNG